MVRRALSAALAAAASFAIVSASGAPTCGIGGNKCPSDTPCCDSYNQCGVGAYCLGGCDPVNSYDFSSCYNGPACKSGNFDFSSMDDVQSIDDYLGDASKVNWVSQGTAVKYNGNVLLTMAEGTVGTLLASTHYVWYGKICAKMTTSQGQGVVTAFIMMSDVKDEIDFEFVGVDTKNTQSNYFSQGVTVKTDASGANSEMNLTVGDTVGTVNEYCIDWQEDTLTWIINGNEERTLKRSDTWNSTSGKFDYPQTPSRIELSLWPAGLSTNAKGTVEWAGGLINWNSPYMQNGYYYAMVESVTVDCYDPPPMAINKGSKAYMYTDKAATNNTVEITDTLVILGSLQADGDHPNVGATTVSNAPKATKSVDTVPGGLNGGNGAKGADATASASAAAASGTDAASPASTGDSGGGDQSFSQGGKSGSGSLEPGLGKLGGSALAIVVAVLGLLVL